MKRKITITLLIIILLAVAVIIGINAFTKQPEVKEQKNMKSQNQNNIIEGGSYEAFITESQIEWHGEKIVGTQHTGTIKLSSAQIKIKDKENFESANFILDMNSIEENNTGQEGVTKHLKNADFFDVEKYPTANLKITKVEKKEGNMFELTGNLTIKDVTNEIIFPAEIEKENNQILANAEFNIDRTKWGIQYGSGQFFKDLADKAIKDEINFKVNLKAELKK